MVPRISLIALTALVAGPVLAATPTQSPQEQEQEQDQELGEILVEGSKPIRKQPQVVDWLRRLPGRFIVDGTVELHGEGDARVSQPAQGRVDCETVYDSPANQIPEVLCELKIRWPATQGQNGETLPGGVSALNAAQILFFYDRDHIGIRYLLVDSNGIAEDALGYLLTGDVLVTRRRCVNVPGNCERMVRITAKPDLKEVVMKIIMEVEYRKAASFTFVMHRVPGTADAPRAKKK